MSDHEREPTIYELRDKVIDDWYASCRPRHIDLVGDYAGRELFLLEGDSLLRECFSDDRIDFEDGFQMLHAIFVVERFLQNLIQRYCRFHIAFFEEHAILCIPPGVTKGFRSRYLLCRSVVLRHLQLHLPESSGVQVHKFQSLHSNEFNQHLRVSPVHFVMAHDGSLPMIGKFSREKKSSGQAKAVLQRNILWFNTHRLNVALINQIEFRDSKVFTMILEGWNPTGLRHGSRRARISRWSKVSLNMASEYGQTSTKSNVLVKEWLSLPEVRNILREGSCSMAESWLLTACNISVLLSMKKDNLLCSAFVLHSLLVKHVALSHRRLPIVRFKEEFETQIEDFVAVFAETAIGLLADENWVAAMDASNVEYDLVDMVDGRLFRVVLQAIVEGTLVSALPAAIRDDWGSASKVIFAASGQPLSLAPEPEYYIVVEDQEDQSGKDIGEQAVMPFSNSVFDKHLACIHVDADATLPTRLSSMKLYHETTHWHNRKPLNPKRLPAAKVTKWKNPLRTNQFYMAEMTAYAASLSGAKGKVLEPETITVGVKKLSKPPDATSIVPEPAASAKKGGKKTAPVLSRKQQIIADNKERKGSAESDKTFDAWIAVVKAFDDLSSDQERYLRAKAYSDGLDSSKAIHIEAEVNLYLLQALLAQWATYCKEDKKSEGLHVAALIWTLVRTTSSSSGVTKEIVHELQKITNLLSLTDAMNTNIALAPDRKLSFNFKYPTNVKSLQIGLPQQEFQLLHVGPYMDRLLDAQPDPRVSSFIPDGWQRKVLDELDANHSVFVVAPTSAGKTFISFYAMEQVLRADYDGVLVYVAPTKALVNQIAAEIQGRFSKKYPQAGKSVWAIHTRDYRVNNSTGCQILVTVPHILQIMLLAPSNAKSWAPRVRRIIFDEIHSIGQAEDGVVWEQLLLLAPCPIIALSATVGNPTEFSDWLAETQKENGTELTMIQHSTRYSDLRKYLYTPPQTFNFTGFGKSQAALLGLDGLSGLSYFHPVASLIDKSRGIPDDLALEPRDCFLLWKAMCKFETEKYSVPKDLDPSKALPLVIKKADIFKWEKQLKKLLLDWMTSIDSPFDNLIRELSPPDTSKNNGETEVLDEKAIAHDTIDMNDLRATTLPLLYQLHKRQALPAILFNYDRNGCEDIASNLLQQLTVAEDQWKKGKEWQHKMEDWTKWKELKEKKGSKKPSKVSKKKGGGDDEKTSKADQARDDATSEVSSFELFDPDEPLDNFSFADKKKCQKTELDDYIRQLRWKRIREELIELLKRGIGVHHSGMNRKYRQCVEMLFRKGYLRVVVATGTLSLGINMPCATVVFSGDSVFLTALNFRQASGRSGRRGFDLLGNVVFQGITTERACRLLSSRLPDLTGHFPITTTLVLRLFTLLHDSKNAPYAVKAINSLLSQPRLYLGGESFREQVLHHLRFSIEYLRRQELLGPSGEPINFTSCVSHLYFTENSSFAFHALLKDGYFKNLCADIDTKTEHVLWTMMLVLSHLFGRRACRETKNEEVAEKIHRSSSMVYLPPLPEAASAPLRKHNANTLSIFSTYVKTFAEQHVSGEERLLPLSRIAIGCSEPPMSDDTTSNALQANRYSNGDAHGLLKSPSTLGAFSFLPTLPIPRARSAFVALSGHGDDFTTINDLCTSARSGIFLESAVIPHLELHPDEAQSPLNAYLLDFFIHGTLQPLADANGIPRSDVWFVLNDFSLVLATIVTSLAGYLGLGMADVNEEILDTMGSGDRAENEGDEEMAAETASITTSATTQSLSSVSSNLEVRSKKVRKVAEDWNADEDAIVAQEKRDEEEERAPKMGTDDEEYQKLMNVYRAFKKLKTEFDAKFRAIWA